MNPSQAIPWYRSPVFLGAMLALASQVVVTFHLQKYIQSADLQNFAELVVQTLGFGALVTVLYKRGASEAQPLTLTQKAADLHATNQSPAPPALKSSSYVVELGGDASGLMGALNDLDVAVERVTDRVLTRLDAVQSKLQSISPPGGPTVPAAPSGSAPPSVPGSNPSSAAATAVRTSVLIVALGVSALRLSAAYAADPVLNDPTLMATPLQEMVLGGKHVAAADIPVHAPGEIGESVEVVPGHPLTSVVVTQCSLLVAVYMTMPDGRLLRMDQSSKISPTELLELANSADRSQRMDIGCAGDEVSVQERNPI